MDNEKSYQVLGMCQSLCPTGKEQAAFARAYNDMRKDADVSEAELIKTLIGKLYDGLAYGNWPYM